MRLGHFEIFRPRCPVCAASGRDAPLLDLHHIERRLDDDVLEGVLVCPALICRFEYPILDGIPILVPNLRDVIAGQLGELRARDDLSLFAESLLGDAAGPGAEIDRTRYHLSTYARSHWGDLDVDPPTPEGTVAALVDSAMSLLPAPPRGPWLDLGCSVGRSTFEITARTGDLVLGLDLNLAMLRLARRVVTEGRARYPRRRVGIVYDRREVAVDLPGRDRVDYWACDATTLPFAAGVATGALSLNVLDCVNVPLAHLVELGRAVRAGGDVLLATPYDWSAAATPVESWLGGHSQRAPHQGSSASELRRILSSSDAAGAHTGLVIESERDGVPWHVYVHERATMTYRVHLVHARRRAGIY